MAFAQVDMDQEQTIGKALTGGGPIPQLIIYRKTPQGWKFSRLVGGNDAKAVEKFIAEATAAPSRPALALRMIEETPETARPARVAAATFQPAPQRSGIIGNK